MASSLNVNPAGHGSSHDSLLFSRSFQQASCPPSWNSLVCPLNPQERLEIPQSSSFPTRRDSLPIPPSPGKLLSSPHPVHPQGGPTSPGTFLAPFFMGNILQFSCHPSLHLCALPHRCLPPKSAFPVQSPGTRPIPTSAVISGKGADYLAILLKPCLALTGVLPTQ